MHLGNELGHGHQVGHWAKGLSMIVHVNTRQNDALAGVGQLVGHGHVRVNGHKLDIASAVIKSGDEIEIKNLASSRQLAQRNLEENRGRPVPGWLTLNAEQFKAVVNRLPNRDEIAANINEQLIVEFYSRF
jgi:small subunit ribosomal protein S4